MRATDPPPRLDRVDQHVLSPRGAMELPESFVPSRLGDLTAHFRALRCADAAALVDALADPALPLPRRFAAGTLLALQGDPRLDPLSPAMIDIPGGRVHLGLEAERVDAVTAAWARYGVKRDWIAKEAPLYTVDLPPYRIGRYPVTHLEFQRFVSETGHPALPNAWFLGAFPPALANHPVYSVTEHTAEAYAAWLSARTGRHFRLPTEAEWEYAAAGPERREFPWGADFDPDRANTMEAGLLTTTPVGCFPSGRSPFGLEDMGGNVEEYVADDYAPYPGGEAIRDDLTDVHGDYRVARGGSFTRFGDLARCTRRHGRYPNAHYVMGFRLAETPPGLSGRG